MLRALNTGRMLEFELVEEGHFDRLLVSQDIGKRSFLICYGGYGYAYFPSFTLRRNLGMRRCGCFPGSIRSAFATHLFLERNFHEIQLHDRDAAWRCR